jgi:opacity protein-like surface antigen
MRLALRMMAGISLALSVLSGAVAPMTVPAASAAGWTGAYSVYTAHSFSFQHLDYTCVGASVQMMLNMIRNESDHSATVQKRYWSYGRDHDKYPGGMGIDPVGWVAALEHFGAGDYAINTASSYQSGLRQLAAAMRATGRPVGLFVDHGGHAWVMTGFAATADPRVTSQFRVTSVQAMGPLYPDGTIHGTSYDPGPKTWLSADKLRAKFTPMRWTKAPEWDGRWIAVIPA